MAKDKTPSASAQARAAEAPALPTALRLTAAHGYWTEDGRLMFWREGEPVSDAALIAELIERGAPVEAAA